MVRHCSKCFRYENRFTLTAVLEMDIIIMISVFPDEKTKAERVSLLKATQLRGAPEPVLLQNLR